MKEKKPAFLFNLYTDPELTTKNTYMNLKGVMRRVCKTCDRARRKIQRERIRQAKELGDSEAEKNSGTWSRV